MTATRALGGAGSAPPFTAPTSADEVRAYIRNSSVEFLFAQFVDMHAKPNAKLVPAGHIDDLSDGRRGLRRLRRRRHRPAAERSRHARDPRHPQLHAAALAAHRGALRVRRDGGGRGMAVLPAHDPAPPARARGGARIRVQDRRRARVLPRAQEGGRLDRARRSARHPRAALLRHARADPQPRLRERGRQERHLARLGQLRHRPRGRQRPVRAELRVRRRADHLRPGDLLPLHGGGHGSGARADRDLHAQAVRSPDRQRLPLPHEPLARRRERLRRATGR